MTRRRPAASAVQTQPVTLNKPKFRVPTMRGASGIKAQMMAMQHEVAAPYETAAKQSRLPSVGNPGPIALANFQARKRALGRHFTRTDPLYRSIHNNSALAIVGTGPVPTGPFRDLMALWPAFARNCGSLQFGLGLLTRVTDVKVAGDCFAIEDLPGKPRAEHSISTGGKRYRIDLEPAEVAGMCEFSDLTYVGPAI